MQHLFLTFLQFFGKLTRCPDPVVLISSLHFLFLKIFQTGIKTAKLGKWEMDELNQNMIVLSLTDKLEEFLKKYSVPKLCNKTFSYTYLCNITL